MVGYVHVAQVLDWDGYLHGAALNYQCRCADADDGDVGSNFEQRLVKWRRVGVRISGPFGRTIITAVNCAIGALTGVDQRGGTTRHVGAVSILVEVGSGASAPDVAEDVQVRVVGINAGVDERYVHIHPVIYAVDVGRGAQIGVDAVNPGG